MDKISVLHDFCIKIVDGQLPTTLFKQVGSSDMAQTAGEHQSWCGNTFPCSVLICAVDFNPLTNYTNLDAELLCLSKCFTVSYEESVVL